MQALNWAPHSGAAPARRTGIFAEGENLRGGILLPTLTGYSLYSIQLHIIMQLIRYIFYCIGGISFINGNTLHKLLQGSYSHTMF